MCNYSVAFESSTYASYIYIYIYIYIFLFHGVDWPFVGLVTISHSSDSVWESN